MSEEIIEFTKDGEKTLFHVPKIHLIKPAYNCYVCGLIHFLDEFEQDEKGEIALICKKCRKGLEECQK